MTAASFASNIHARLAASNADNISTYRFGIISDAFQAPTPYETIEEFEKAINLIPDPEDPEEEEESAVQQSNAARIAKLEEQVQQLMERVLELES